MRTWTVAIRRIFSKVFQDLTPSNGMQAQSEVQLPLTIWAIVLAFKRLGACIMFFAGSVNWGKVLHPHIPDLQWNGYKIYLKVEAEPSSYVAEFQRGLDLNCLFSVQYHFLLWIPAIFQCNNHPSQQNKLSGPTAVECRDIEGLHPEWTSSLQFFPLKRLRLWQEGFIMV